MTTHVHELAGCAAAPLAHYLKALAVLRLISEQADTTARGFWRGESFRLATKLSKEGLVRFFLDDYRPTPILSPWNGGSGFFYEDDVALGSLEGSKAPRFAPFREGIAAARGVCAPLAAAIAASKTADEALKKSKKDETLKADAARAKAARDEAKAGLIPACRRAWSDGLLEWFDAAIVVGADGDAAWPALLGSGGNDGRLDFTHNSMEHLARLLDCAGPRGEATPLGRAMLPAALFGATSPGLAAFAAGQFMPGRAGGDNMGQGFDGESLVNSWDFVLMLEGTVVLASGLARRANGEGLPQAAAPFAVRSGAAGYGSADRADEGPRGEQWMPLWSQPSRYAEVRSLFAEGRVQMGRDPATRATDVPRALARLGTARGVVSFERFGFIERNGQSNLAVPLGRWSVSKPDRQEDLLDDVERWVSRFRAVAREAHAPRSISSAGRTLDERFLALCRPGSDSLRWQQLLEALGDAEAALLGSPKTAADPKKRLTPLPPLRAEWVDAADDGTPEVRLAVALASQSAAFRSRNDQVLDGVRGHWLPLDHSQGTMRAGRFAITGSSLRSDPDVVCRGEELERDCIALVRRRVEMAGALDARAFGLTGAEGYEASVEDVMSFLDDAVDGRRVVKLARALMAVTWVPRAARRHSFGSIDPTYAILRLAHTDRPLAGSDMRVRLDSEPVARLAAGDLEGAVAVCLRRLGASGLVPKLRVVIADEKRVHRLLASLAFPISADALRRCLTLVTKPDHDDSN